MYLGGSWGIKFLENGKCIFFTWPLPPLKYIFRGGWYLGSQIYGRYSRRMMLGVTDHASSLSGHHHFRFCGAGDQEMSTKLTIKGEDFVWKNIEQLRFIYIVCSRKKTRKKNGKKNNIFFFSRNKNMEKKRYNWLGCTGRNRCTSQGWDVQQHQDSQCLMDRTIGCWWLNGFVDLTPN